MKVIVFDDNNEQKGVIEGSYDLNDEEHKAALVFEIKVVLGYFEKPQDPKRLVATATM